MSDLTLSFTISSFAFHQTMFQGRLSFSTLVFSLRLYFEVDYVSRSTMYRDSTVFKEKVIGKGNFHNLPEAVDTVVNSSNVSLFEIVSISRKLAA